MRARRTFDTAPGGPCDADLVEGAGVPLWQSARLPQLGTATAERPASREAARAYEEHFRPSGLASNPPEPYFMYAMNVCAPAASVVEPGGQWPQHVSGAPEHVAEMLEVMARETDGREVMVQDLIIGHEDRLLLAATLRGTSDSGDALATPSASSS